MFPAEISKTHGEYTFLSSEVQESSNLPDSQLIVDTTPAMDEGVEMSENVDSKGEGFITSPKSTFGKDIVQVRNDPANFYMVVRASDINLYFLMSSFTVYSSIPLSASFIAHNIICKYYLNPDVYHVKLGLLSELVPLRMLLLSHLGNMVIVW